MDTSHRLALPLLAAGQAQKHITHNDALVRLDLLVHLVLSARDVASPPLTPDEGVVYAVPAGASGAWAGHDGKLAARLDGGWLYFTPQDGWRAFVLAEARTVVHVDGAWVAEEAMLRQLGPLERLGIGTHADAANPVAARLNATLWTAKPAAEGGTGDLRFTIDKEGPARTASLLFQSAYSGRAEIGLSGDDQLRFKVSADGSAWTEALAVDGASGALAIRAGSTAAPSLSFAGDPDTGLCQVGANGVAIATGGTERLRINNLGAIGIGTSALTGYGLRIGRGMTGAANTFGIGITSTIQSDSSGIASPFMSLPATAAAGFTVASLRHFNAGQGTLGSGSAIGTQMGFFAASSLTGAVSNYGFYGDLAATTGRWNFYANGTAPSHFNGAVCIGDTATPEKLTVAGNIAPATDNAYSLGTAALRASVVYAATGVINTSDAREKCEIEPSELGLDFIRRLQPRSYRWRIGGHDAAAAGTPAASAPATGARPGRRRHHGLLAQEVRQALDQLGVTDFAGFVLADPADPESRHGLRYDQFLAPLVKAVQELDTRLARLEA